VGTQGEATGIRFDRTALALGANGKAEGAKHRKKDC
jgi:hypothetical protein